LVVLVADLFLSTKRVVPLVMNTSQFEAAARTSETRCSLAALHYQRRARYFLHKDLD
jgi:hypothetical protein